MIKYIIVVFFLIAETVTAGEIITAPVIKKDSPEYKAAEEIAKKHYSPEVQNRIKKECQKLKPMVEEQKKIVKKEIGIDEKEKDGHEILIFVSESMPVEAVAAYVRDASLILNKSLSAVKIVLNGFPSKGIHHFTERVGSDVEGLEVSISGFLFKQYDIETVPVVVIDDEFVIKHPRDLRDAIQLIDRAEDQKFIKDLLYALN